MTIKLQDLRRYAILERTDIGVVDSSGRRAVVNVRGQVQIPGDDKELRLDDVIASAEFYEIKTEGRNSKLRTADVEKLIGEMYKKRGVAHEEHDED